MPRNPENPFYTQTALNPLGDEWGDLELGKLNLTADQEDAIVAFLKTLSDGYVPNLVNSASLAADDVLEENQLFLPLINTD